MPEIQELKDRIGILESAVEMLEERLYQLMETQNLHVNTFKLSAEQWEHLDEALSEPPVFNQNLHDLLNLGNEDRPPKRFRDISNGE